MAGINPSYKGPTGLWFGMVRGSDKSSSIGRVVNWCLAFSKNRLKISVAAADGDQAKIVRNAMDDEARLNPWFGELIKIDKYAAKGPGGEMEILTADAGTTYGLTSDIYICDELTHWKNEDFWTALYSGRMKRPGCLYFVLTNAGYMETWQRRLFEELKTDPSWMVYEAPGVQAGWVDKQQLERDRRKIPEMEARRLYDNIWVPSSGNAVFPHEEIQKVFVPGKVPKFHLKRYQTNEV